METNPRNPLDLAAKLSASPAGQTQPGYEQAVQLYREALESDEDSPYRWADLAEALQAAGHTREATLCFERAMALAPSIPQIWVRHANFLFMEDRPNQALSSAAKALATVPDFDEVLFGNFDRLIDDPAVVAATIANQPRILQSWMKHLIAVHDAPAAALAWSRIAASGHADASLTSDYVRYLLESQHLAEAQTVWSEWLGDKKGDYPRSNLIFNGRFESDPTGSPLDWSITKPHLEEADFYETIREKDGVRIQFNGKSNIKYDNVSQLVVLPRAGKYRLTAHMKSMEITTNEGPRLAVTDLNLASESLTGSHDWMAVSLEFTTSQPRAVRVAIIRRPSEKFDNKISGIIWVSRMTLTPVIPPS